MQPHCKLISVVLLKEKAPGNTVQKLALIVCSFVGHDYNQRVSSVVGGQYPSLCYL